MAFITDQSSHFSEYLTLMHYMVTTQHPYRKLLVNKA